MPDFDFAVLGAGAMGSIVGGHLARAGHSVVMLARGERAQQLERYGLTIKGLAALTTPRRTLREPAAPLAALRHADFGVTLSIQNGPLKNELLAQAFGKERVLGALADTSGELLADGAGVVPRNVNILLGELSGGDSARAQRLARTLETSGVRAAASAEILTLEWSKFCAWAGLMALSVTTRAVTWKYLLDPDCALVLARLVREMGVLARALGIGLSDRSILPVASMCAGPEAQALAAVMKAGREYRATAPGHRLSSLQDLEAGRPLEGNATLRYATAKARELGLTLPLLEAFALLIAGLDRVRRDAVPAEAP